MCQPEYHNGVHARVAENNFVFIESSRVPVELCLHRSFHQVPNFGYAGQKLHGDFLGPLHAGVVICTAEFRQVTQVHGNLLGQIEQHILDESLQIVLCRIKMIIFVAVVPREQNLLQFVQNIHHDIHVGTGKGIHLIDGTPLTVVFQYICCQLFDLWFYIFHESLLRVGLVQFILLCTIIAEVQGNYYI